MKGRVARYALGASVLAIAAFLLHQRWRPMQPPPSLTFLFENPIAEAFVGRELLLRRLGLAPGMRVLDAGCGPGRVTTPLARAVGPDGEVYALDGRRVMLEKLRRRVREEGLSNALAGEVGFDRILLGMVLGEVRDKRAALGQLHAPLKSGGVLLITETSGDPDYRLPAAVRREAAGFRLVRRFGGFPAYTLDFEKATP